MINNRATPSISDSRIAGPAGAERGFTLLELLVVVALLGVIAALTVPLLIRMRQTGNEASAIGSMRAITSAQAAYSSSCGGGGYAQTLADLALPPPARAPFISPDMAVGTKSGYITALDKSAGAQDILPGPSTCNSASTPSVTGYHVTSVPEDVGSTGQRGFASDNRGTIYYNDTGAVIANPIPAASVPLK